MAETVSKEILHLIFIDDLGKTRTVRIPDPKETLTATEIETVMDKLITKNVLRDTFVNKKGAKVVETLTEEFDITVS